jgi:sirohydrochlorin cobaltochelatase
MPPPPVSAAPMGGAPFVWRDDGRPDWSAMWTSFCDLALYGGPPHRGEDSALVAPAADAVPTAGDAAMLTEIRRGIWETTGLFAEQAGAGWVAVTCASRKMAAWLTATIILENVEARCEEERLLLPTQPGLTLTDQVKSLVTVVAKTHHYWQAHVTGNGTR